MSGVGVCVDVAARASSANTVSECDVLLVMAVHVSLGVLCVLRWELRAAYTRVACVRARGAYREDLHSAYRMP